MNELLFATTNQGKRKELIALLGDKYKIILPNELGVDTDVEETGRTFAENSRIKAVTLGRLSGMMTVADDSGLEIDALNGAPGIYSARFGGHNTSYDEKFRLLMELLQDVPADKRTARFKCAITLYESEDKITVFEDKVEGLIAYERKGENGFGYDPIFYVPEFGKHMAELSPEIKNQISHRGKAVRKLAEYLLNIKKGAE